MIKKSVFGVMLLFQFSLMGCAVTNKVMINPTTKEKVNCSTWGFGVVGTPLAVASYLKCVNEAEALGYIPFEEYEKRLAEHKDMAVPATISCTNPVWSENMEWTYSTPAGERTLRIVKKDSFKGIPVYYLSNGQGKQLMLDESLGLCAILNNGNIEGEYTPPLENYDWPLAVGKKWESSSIMKTPTGNLEVTTSYEVQSYGKVHVPAGTFDAYYIVGKNHTGLTRVVRRWYSPKVKNYVQAITYSQDGYAIEKLVRFQEGKQGT